FCHILNFYYIFFFQAEDGIRDRNVTGVQTCALPILRASDINIAIVCSAAELVLPSGAFTTITPFSVAASKSMLSTPTPARAITFKLFACSITSHVTFFWLITSTEFLLPIYFSITLFILSYFIDIY